MKDQGEKELDYIEKGDIGKGLRRGETESVIKDTEEEREQYIMYLTWDKENPLSATLVQSKVLFCKSCCNMTKIAHIINQIRFFQPLTNSMNHKH